MAKTLEEMIVESDYQFFVLEWVQEGIKINPFLMRSSAELCFRCCLLKGGARLHDRDELLSIAGNFSSANT